MMMDIFNELGGLEGMQQQVGQQLGTDPSQTGAALEAAVPLLLGALTRNSQTPEGAAALDNALNDHSGEALSQFQQGQMPDLSEGEKILGHVFGNQQSAAVNAVSQRAGISPQLAMQILMMAAPLVLGYLSRQRGQQGGGIGGILGSILGGLGGSSMGGMGNFGGLGGGLGGVLGSVLGGNLGGGLGGALGGILGSGTQAQQSNPGFQNQGVDNSGMSDSTLGGDVLPGYPGNAGTPAQTQTQSNAGGLVGTLNSVLEGGEGNALNDLIGMFGGRRS